MDDRTSWLAAGLPQSDDPRADWKALAFDASMRATDARAEATQLTLMLENVLGAENAHHRSGIVHALLAMGGAAFVGYLLGRLSVV
jgi:hypothetical protein